MTASVIASIMTPSIQANPVFPIENEDPVSMKSVTGFEFAPYDLVFNGKKPEDFSRAVREVISDPTLNLQLRIKTREQNPTRGVINGFRLQARRLPNNTHWTGIMSSDWEVWIQILITMEKEPDTGRYMVKIMYSVGERPVHDNALTQLQSYSPAVTLVDNLRKALQAKFDSIVKRR
jgi:hypothetical protein